MFRKEENEDEEVWTGKYAILEIEGCRGCGVLQSVEDELGRLEMLEDDDLGATVGEFEVIGRGGEKGGMKGGEDREKVGR